MLDVMKGARWDKCVAGGIWPDVDLMCRNRHGIVRVRILDLGGFWQLVAVGSNDSRADGPYSFSSDTYETLPGVRPCAWNPEIARGETFGGLPQTCNQPIETENEAVYTCPEHGSRLRCLIGPIRTTFVCVGHRKSSAPIRFTRTHEDLLEAYCQAVAAGKRYAIVQAGQ